MSEDFEDLVFIGGPCDGKRVRVTQRANQMLLPAPLEETSDAWLRGDGCAPMERSEVYVRQSISVPEDRFYFMVHVGMTPGTAVRALIDGYKPR